MKKQYTFRWIIFLVCVFTISGVYSIQAGDSKDMGGWGMNDPYNKLYNAADVERIKVVVTEVKEVIPIPGMSPGVALVVKEGGEGEEILVHLCPVWYKKASQIGIRKGDKIDLRGYFAEINGEEVIMAAKIKRKGKSFKVRLSSDGTPFWTLSPAALQKELSGE
ncbi:MAG: hypothetical protein QNK40_13250 [Desulfobacterales bacterium]|nr:hypothetical protein [Desulfobacterales bacterium]MDX2509936.1 hypothetical protein [Desulfobacterales bacterium]